MVIAPRDSEILRSDEIFQLYDEYEEKFGEQFAYFNYADFQGTESIPAAQVYLDTLRKAVKADKPYHIVSHRYDSLNP